ncbi:Crp/Fnr family transcriptional regulator [Sporolactobacillus vineae]|uniref:Crp/Fnr family transcriptional regulator n=1 Tax=Sporolactobacillus vineae TaxID=444463 RepID=UPI000289960C|nr:Crp/Fnr family transcriptional regulator [Sporolactobacillus vineae]
MIDRLPELGWLQPLSEKERTQLEKEGRFRTYPSKSVLFFQGQPLSDYFFILDGLVSAYQQNESGKRLSVSLFTPGDFFPHVGLLTDAGAYPANAEAITSCRLFILPKEKAWAAFETLPALRRKLTRFLIRKNHELMQRYSDALLHSAADRLLNFLRQLALKIGRRRADGWYAIGIHLTGQNIADYLGIAPETVSRLLHQLVSERFVRREEDRKLLVKIDPQKGR